jgi:hypothetical protein
MTNEILRLIPTIQSINLVEHNLNYLKKKKKKKIVNLGIDNIVGSFFIKETADFIG